MTTIEIIKAVKDYGVNAVLVIAVLWMNSRMNDIEARFYDCLDSRLQDRNSFNNTSEKVRRTSELFAVFPREIEVIKCKKSKDAKDC